MYWLDEPKRNHGSHLYLDAFWHNEPHEARDASLESLQRVIDHLDKVKDLNFWVSSGTALVINRDVSHGRNFLPHPKAVLDIDILVDEKISLARCEEILPNFRLFNVRGTEEDVMNIHLSDWEDNKVLFAFWFYKRVKSKKEYVLNYYDCTQRFDYFHKEENHNLSYLSFEGYRIPFFCDPDKYCEIRYGKDWKTPKQTIGVFAHGSPNIRRK